MGKLPNLIIIGSGRGGTTSLFRYLSRHPDICASSKKEIGFFTPLIYGGTIPELYLYKKYFDHCEDDLKYYLEASPGYFAGGRLIAEKIKDCLGENLQIILTLREPVSRFISYYHYEKSRLRISKNMSVEEFFLVSLDISNKTGWNWDERHFWGFRECFYADYIEDWLNAYPSNFHIVFFDDLIKTPVDVLAGLCEKLAISPEIYLESENNIFTPENRSMSYRNSGLQRLAILANQTAGYIWHRWPVLKTNLREMYYALNGRQVSNLQDPEIKGKLEKYFAPYNIRLAEILNRRCNYLQLPSWLQF